MCYSNHHTGFGMGSGFGMPFLKILKTSCCHPYEMSKEAKTKELEAMKARLEDFIAHIDKQIEDLEKVEEEV